MNPLPRDRPDDAPVTVASSGAGPPTPICTVCGTPMPIAGPEGGCLRCLFATGSAITGGEGDDADPTATLAESGADAAFPPTPARTRFGHFEIARHPDGSPHELGRGSMGVSYLARDTVLDCPVALKVIDARLSAKADARARFLREARAAAQLRHTHVASVFHYGEEAGQCFYAMEFVEGETLEARVRRDGPLPPVLALEVARQVAYALIAADARGVVHRDLKPSNLMVSASDSSGTETPLIKVIDFGLAKAVAAVAGTGGGRAADLTHGGFVGTPAFASPEQFAAFPGEESSGRGSGRIDTRADIYSLGVTLWYLLTGKVPFVGSTLTEIHDRQVRHPLPLDHLTRAKVPAPVVTLLRGMLAPDPAERPQTPRELSEQLRRCRKRVGPGAGSAPGRREWTALAVGLAALLIAAAAVAAWLARWGNRPIAGTPPAAAGTASPAANVERSVAVLPFENLSDDKDNAFFADGVQDDVITSLAKIRDLKVIGRASVMGYRGATGAEKLREIGQTLDVRSLLEGSVRRAGDRVIVSARLLDPRDGRQIWGETYDRTLRDALSIQGELAREIAAQLHATLTPEERARLERPPTENADAYALYLRAMSFSLIPVREDKRTAVRLLEQATALDPSFALAWAQLALARSGLHNWEPSEELKAATLAAAREALRLRPDQAEAHRALGSYHYIKQNFPAALEEFQLAAKSAPNDLNVLGNIATTHSRQGRWREARAGYERATALSPRESSRWAYLALCARNLRDWPAVARAQERVLALAPDVLSYRLARAETEFLWKGDLAPLKAVLATVSPGGDPNQSSVLSRYQVAMYERDYSAAEVILTSFPGESIGVRNPKNFFLGRVYQARGGPDDAARARACFEAAREPYETLARKDPNNHRYHASLGLLYACLGWRDAAVGQARYALALCPESRDAIDGAYVALDAALTHACLGEADAALPIIEHLLAVPTVVMNIHELRLDPDWDPIRADPRFAALGERAGVPFPPPP